MTSYFPHLVCLRGDPWLVGTSFATDILIALAYFAVPITIGILQKKKLLTFDRKLKPVWSALQIFILACGTGHCLDAANLWLAWYWPKVAMNAITAAASLSAVLIFARHGEQYRRLVSTETKTLEALERLCEKMGQTA